MKDLEQILQEYFGCSEPFDEYGEFTIEGDQAYDKLINLINDISVLTGLGFSGQIVRVLDEICDEKY